MSEKYDALKDRRCKTCAAWHNPGGTPVAACVRHPGMLFIVAAMPGVGAMLRSPGAPPPPQLQLQSAPIPKAADDGCLEWVTREAIN
jgi:hypothetical protein